MWIALAFMSAFFAGITSILAKCGIKSTDSTLATAIRTIIVLLMSFIMAYLNKSIYDLTEIDVKSWFFLIISGLSTGASWLCYFKALKLGDVNKVTAIDKTSTIMSILLSIIVFNESVKPLKILSIVLIAVGTALMVVNRGGQKIYYDKKNNSYFVFAVLSAIFAAATSILAKIGIDNVESNLGTFIRTFVVLIMAWLIVLFNKKAKEINKINKRELILICLSGVATGASWLCYFNALKNGVASAVISIDKLSILVTAGFSYFALKEKMNVKSLAGLILITAGSLLMLI